MHLLLWLLATEEPENFWHNGQSLVSRPPVCLFLSDHWQTILSQPLWIRQHLLCFSPLIHFRFQYWSFRCLFSRHNTAADNTPPFTSSQSIAMYPAGSKLSIFLFSVLLHYPQNRIFSSPSRSTMSHSLMVIHLEIMCIPKPDNISGLWNGQPSLHHPACLYAFVIGMLAKGFQLTNMK